MGKPTGGARRKIDAKGLALMPGIVDVHTHYDAQITWDRTLSPSPALGVTTAVMGNCGFGIAPCPASQRETMLKNLSVVEGMDLDALLTGTRWEFESFSDYLAQLRRIGPYANVATLAGRSTIRTAVMGDEASTRAEATPPKELTRMHALVRRGARRRRDRAGIVVFPQSRGCRRAADAFHHRTGRGVAFAARRQPGREKGTGVYVWPPDRAGPRRSWSRSPPRRSTGVHGHRAGHVQRGGAGVAMTYYERCAEARARGHEVYIHATCHPLSFDFTLRIRT